MNNLRISLKEKKTDLKSTCTKVLIKAVNNKTEVEWNCIECEKGYYVDSSKEEGCSECPNDWYEVDKCSTYVECMCTSCKKGYVLDKYENNTLYCKDVKEIDENCKSSDSLNYCSECKEGYYLNKEMICGKKDSNCNEYGNNKCQRCNVGYNLNS